MQYGNTRVYTYDIFGIVTLSKVIENVLVEIVLTVIIGDPVFYC